ncbi:MAG: imidazole glycerol phosphate synthase subunit HisH [Cellvibrionales bacterium]|nr:imidazole glycerol phosphate synthase subunit HisH [Cellvibrionales bacterium]
MGKQTVAIIDYGMGNLHSAASALERVADVRVQVTAERADIEAAERVLLPGVGAIRDCMAAIRARGLDRLIAAQIAVKPVLAICVGMQTLMRYSEENAGVDCLGQIDGRVCFFGDDLRDSGAERRRLKVPHMGWNRVRQRRAHPLWAGIAQDSHFYFVHSYYVRLGAASLLAGSAEYGVEFAAAVAAKNLFCTQFHPEKSHLAGLQLLRNFVCWDGADG